MGMDQFPGWQRDGHRKERRGIRGNCRILDANSNSWGGQNLRIVSHYLKRYRYVLLIPGGASRILDPTKMRVAGGTGLASDIHILTICPSFWVHLNTFDYCRRTVRACIFNLFETTQLYSILKLFKIDTIQPNRIQKTLVILVHTAFPDFKQSAFSPPRTSSTSLQRPSPPLGDGGTGFMCCHAKGHTVALGQ